MALQLMLSTALNAMHFFITDISDPDDTDENDETDVNAGMLYGYFSKKSIIHKNNKIQANFNINVLTKILVNLRNNVKHAPVF